jgi:hypothetical protein
MTGEEELAEAIRDLIKELELCRKTYAALWIPLSLGLLVILAKIAGFW